MSSDVRLLQFSDPHLFAHPKGQLRGVDTLASLRDVLADAMRRGPQFEAVLCSGDLVNDDPGGYSHFERELSALNKPVYCVPGNHDDPVRMRRALSKAPFQVGGYVDLGAWRIVLVDTCVPGRAIGRVSRTELRALEAALSGSDRYAMICMHHHPIEMSSNWLDAVSLENADEFHALLDAHPRVRLVSWGHVHQSYDGRRRGVRMLATPSTCGQFLPLSDKFAIDNRPPAYRRLNLASDGTVESDLVWLDQMSGKRGSMSATA
jgi:3',5'-cyclic-AMP phosphodiesterase